MTAILRCSLRHSPCAELATSALAPSSRRQRCRLPIPGTFQSPQPIGDVKIRTSAMTCGYYRTLSPVMALPMIIRWISEVPE
jgi:hypothetical protein